MWRKVFKVLFQFLSNHLMILLALVFILIIIWLVHLIWIKSHYKSFFDYKKERLDLRQERALAKLEGKKPCRLLKIRKKFLYWRFKRLKNSIHIVNIKLDNTQEILDKYSYE